MHILFYLRTPLHRFDISVVKRQKTYNANIKNINELKKYLGFILSQNKIKTK